MRRRRRRRRQLARTASAAERRSWSGTARAGQKQAKGKGRNLESPSSFLPSTLQAARKQPARSHTTLSPSSARLWRASLCPAAGAAVALRALSGRCAVCYGATRALRNAPPQCVRYCAPLGSALHCIARRQRRRQRLRKLLRLGAALSAPLHPVSLGGVSVASSQVSAT